MKLEYHENGSFKLIVTRYKNETKYETSFIKNVVDDFKHYPNKTLKDFEGHLKFLAKYCKNSPKEFDIKTGVGSKWVSGSIESKFIAIKIKPNGNYIVEIKEHFKPGECLEQLKKAIDYNKMNL